MCEALGLIHIINICKQLNTSLQWQQSKTKMGLGSTWTTLSSCRPGASHFSLRLSSIGEPASSVLEVSVMWQKVKELARAFQQGVASISSPVNRVTVMWHSESNTNILSQDPSWSRFVFLYSNIDTQGSLVTGTESLGPQGTF